MSGFHTNIEEATLSNEFYRKVLFTAPNSQLVLMTLQPKEDIGMETHDNDQFFRIEAGEGKAIIDGQEIEFQADDALIVPAGAKHNIINTSDTHNLKLYTIYSPAHHPEGTIHTTKAEAEAED